jgi:hypothetical protein
MTKRVKESEPESGLVKVVDPLYDAPVEVQSIPETPPPPSGPTFGQRLRRGLELTLRLLSWIIIFGVLGAGLYYGLPLLYQKFVVPVEQNTAQMAELQSRQQQLQQELMDQQEQLKTLQAGQEQNGKSLTELDQRVGGLETQIASHTKSLASLERMQTELQQQDEATTAELQREISIMKSMELLSRARLYMYQSNFGLAEQDIKIARDLLVDVRRDMEETLADDMDAVILRLDMVLSNLPNFPVAASDDLDIGWQILLAGLPQPTATVGATAMPVGTPSTTPEATLTPTAQVTATP